MFTNRFVTITVIFVVGPAGTVNADGEDTPAQAVPAEVFPLPANTVFERHVVGNGGTVTATGERLIYSNTMGTFGAAFGAGKRVADDIATIAPKGCKLRRYEFPVVGKVNPAGTGGAFTVDFAMYRSCPGSVPAGSRPALIIPGTQGQRTFIDQCQNALDDDNDGFVNDGCPAVDPPETGAQCLNAIDDDGDGKVNDGCPAVGDPETDVDTVPRIISFVAAANISLETNMWFGVTFSRHNAGVIVGAPALVGFSADSYDYPGFPCSATLGGFPDQPHASFNLEIFGDADCPEVFVGYKASNPSGSLYNPGAGTSLADDIKLGVDECQMIAYEVAVGGDGFYTFWMQQDCESGLIAGTERTLSLFESAEVTIARFTFDPPIAIPNQLWFKVRTHVDYNGAVVAGRQAWIGSSEDLFGIEDGLGGCTIIDVPESGVHAAVNLTITCAGSPPAGACCDMVLTDANGEAVCREVPRMNCPWPWPQWTSPLQPSWVEGASCDSEPFPLPCGVAVCCKPDGTCENLTQNQCESLCPSSAGRRWQRGEYCVQKAQFCINADCIDRPGDCALPHPTPGCDDPRCCSEVCNQGAKGAYCCSVEWDDVCVSLARASCLAYADCNNNGTFDECDISDGVSADCNANDVPDECETLPPFDYDFDVDVDLIDLAGFQRCFTGPGRAKLAPCCRMFDPEPDGDVDLADFVVFRRVFSGP